MTTRALWAVTSAAVMLIAGCHQATPAPARTALCDATASPSGFQDAVARAIAGQTICLETGDYGTWTGTDKAITIRAADGATPTMRVNFGGDASGFTLDGMSGMGGEVAAPAHDFVIRNSAFTGSIKIEATNANIVLDHDQFDWDAVYDNGINAKIFVWNDTGAFSGVTVENSSIQNGNLDGIHLGGAGIDVLKNTFANLCDTGTNHTDNIQFEGGQGGRIAGNYVFEDESCPTQGITSYDGGTDGVIVEDNVIDIRRPWGIELYSDTNSIVRHNTLRYYRPSECEFNIPCGQIDVNRKSADPAGSGTQVYDNLTTDVNFTNGSTGTEHTNVNGQRATFVGPLNTYAGFRLASDSPVGLGAASDGLDAGIRVTAAPTPASTGTSAPGAQPQGASALVASLGFAEPSGSLARDRSGLSHDARLHGARRTRAGRHGRALVLGGKGYARLPALGLGSRLTLEAWVAPAARSRRSAGVIVSGRNFGLYAAPRATASVSRARAIGKALLPGRWSHLAATYDGRWLRLYVNGVLRGRRKVTSAIANRSLLIGNGLHGRIDDVRIWRTALTAGAIRADAQVNAAE